MGDLLVGSYFKGETNNEITNLLSENQIHAMDLSSDLKIKEAKSISLRQLGEYEPFHWQIEFPEVFQKGGFDGFVGNPPFLGGRRIRSRLGDNYFLWLKRYFKPNSMNGDLCGFSYLIVLN